jgi:outer membrane protein TolC
MTPSDSAWCRRSIRNACRRPALRILAWRALHRFCVLSATLCIAACTVGSDYHRPPVEIPASFKEGANWQRARANPQGAISSKWWLAYHDDTLSHLIDDALKANQSIVAAEAAYRLAQATVAASTAAALYPLVTADLSASRSGAGSTTGSSTTGIATTPGVNQGQFILSSVAPSGISAAAGNGTTRRKRRCIPA